MNIHYGFLLIAGLALASHAHADDTKPQATHRHGDLGLLKKYGIDQSTQGVIQFLRKIEQGDEAFRKRVQELAVNLGSDDFNIRKQATNELIQLGTLRKLALQKQLAEASEADIEVRFRVKKILKQIPDIYEPLAEEAVELLRRERPPEAVSALLLVLPAFKPEYLYLTTVDALILSTREEHADLLRESIRNGTPKVKAAAIAALEFALREKSIDELTSALKDKDDIARLAAAEALAFHRPKPSVAALIDLLESQQPKVRIHSSMLLRKMTNQKFGFVGGYNTPEFRDEPVKRWRAWFSENADTAKLSLRKREAR